jgi:hypothetical protein
MTPFIKLLMIFSFILLILLSCTEKPRPVLFPVRGTDTVLLGMGREAAGGSADFAKSKKLEYRFETSSVISRPASLEIEYSFNADGKAPRTVLETEGNSWVLPVNDPDTVFHYAVPVQGLENFNITLAGKTDGKPSITIHSIEFKERWFGFYILRDGAPAGAAPGGRAQYYSSPFVARRPGESGGSGQVWEINVPADFGVPTDFFPLVYADMLCGKDSAFDAGKYHLELLPGLERLNVPAGLISPGAPLVLKGVRVDSLRQSYAKPPPFPEPVPADPGLVLSWPLENWRDSRYEVFRWDRFPSLLIFDIADYAMQDRMMKRLAFFVEKKGFRGRLAPDSEIAELHGWNAHDYRAQDLAGFFQAAREAQFPLLAEEQELERILLNTGVLRRAGNTIAAGEGGIISISRESTGYLRTLFLAHEAFHGLFFIDEDFRGFSRRRWLQLPSHAKRFITSYFGYQQYDTSDEYLLVNEFMSHVLQQPVSQAAHYFGVTLPLRLESSWRKTSLPPKDQDTGSYPVLAEAFTREAQAFSDYVAKRWGLAAGRVSLLTVRRP